MNATVAIRSASAKSIACRLLGAAPILVLAATAATAQQAVDPARLASAPRSNDFDAVAFGARHDGSTSDTSALNAAIAAAAAVCGEVYLPAGTYYVPIAASPLQARSCITLRGAGKDQTILSFDDTGLNKNYAALDGSGIKNFTLRDLTLRGTAERQPNTGVGAHNLGLSNCADILIENVKTSYARDMGLVLTNCQRVKAIGVSVAYTQADGMSFQDTSDLTVTDFDIVGANDDAISLHSNDTVPSPVRSNVTIGPGTITESQGISALGPKQIVIHDVTMHRVVSYGINFSASNYFPQGHTAGVAVSIHDNIISDVFARPESPPRNGLAAACMRVNGGPATTGEAAGAPGRAAAGGIVDLFGTGVGHFYTNTGDRAASPGGYFWNISNNQCIRTKPAIAAWADRGGPSTQLWVGNNGATPPWYAGGLTDAQLSASGIIVEGALRYSLIANNIIAASGPVGIQFSQTAITGDYDGLTIKGNIFADFSEHGLQWRTGTADAVTVEANLFDADPRFVSDARRAGGTWAPKHGPTGISAPSKSGLVLELNQFRNMQSPLDGSIGPTVALLNTVFGSFAAVPGYARSNTGVGTPPAQGPGWLWVPSDGNPASATFGQQLAPPDYGALTPSAPSSQQ